jgi:hypothetical protein
MHVQFAQKPELGLALEQAGELSFGVIVVTLVICRPLDRTRTGPDNVANKISVARDLAEQPDSRLTRGSKSDTPDFREDIAGQN